MDVEKFLQLLVRLKVHNLEIDLYLNISEQFTSQISQI